jgi:hypothetical protein
MRSDRLLAHDGRDVGSFHFVARRNLTRQRVPA